MYKNHSLISPFNDALFYRVYHTGVYRHNRLYNEQSGLTRSTHAVFLMPQSGMEAPAGTKYATIVKWRRSPA
ncbi:hypothetical protein FX395_21065 [Salmonella enterica]|nr:hypothetical protein [Salmonella enterica]